MAAATGAAAVDNKKQDGPLQINALRTLSRTLTFILALALAGSASAQGLFQPVALVNDKAVTRYEVDQRVRLLEVLNTPGDLEKLALEKLIDERVQLSATEQFEIEVTDEELATGVEEFASRANLTGQQLLDNLAGEGIAPDSFRDFVKAGLAWRQLVQGRFRAKAQVNETELAIARSQVDPRATAEVLISEIFLPANTPENEAKSNDLAPQIARITSFEEFAAAARQYSAGQSREIGGRVSNWVPVANLPLPIADMLLTMTPGEVTSPLKIPNALALFQLRALREGDASPLNATLDYAAYYIPGGQTAAAQERAARLRAEIDRCDDLYGVAQGQPENVLERVTLPQSQVPADVALELARLDANEVSTNLTRSNGQTLVFLMLCSRTPDANAELTDDAIRQRLFSKRLEDYADNYLAQLRANAIIRTP